MNTRKERGWAGHLCVARSCLFRRNTLVTYPDGKGVVVSTVGNYISPQTKEMTNIGSRRYYETMCFLAVEEDGYIEANVSKQVNPDADFDWSICADNPEDLSPTVDNDADEMHERHVEYFMGLSSCPKTEEEEEEEDRKVGTKPVWISVKDRKPRLGQHVILKVRGGYPIMDSAISAIYTKEIDGEHRFWDLSLDTSYSACKYWFPLPEDAE